MYKSEAMIPCVIPQKDSMFLLMATRLACYWAIVSVLPLTCATLTDVCNETYTNTQGLQCFPCSPGHTKKDDCVTNQTHSQCTQCNVGTYQPHCLSANETGECRNCTLCDVYKQNCTIYRNAVCGGGISDGSGFTALMLTLIWLFSVLVTIFAFVFCQYRYRQRRKQDAKNKWDNRRQMHRGDINCDDRKESNYTRNSIRRQELFAWSSSEKKQNYRKNIDSNIDKIPKTERLFGEKDMKKDICGSVQDIVDVHFDVRSQQRSITGSFENVERSLKNTVSKIPTIECFFRETDKDKDSRGSATNIVDVHVDGSYPNSCTTDKSKVIEDVTKENPNKLVVESKHIAIISPIQGAKAKKDYSLEGNGYGGQQLTQERLQTSGDSENTPKENTNDKESNNNGSSPSFDENQKIIPFKEQSGFEERGVAHTEIDWLRLFTELIPHLPPDDSSWTFFAIDLLQNSQNLCGLPKNITNEISKIKGKDKQKDLAYLELFTTWCNIMASYASLAHIKEALKRFNNLIVMEEFGRIEQNPPIRKKGDPNSKTSIIPSKLNEQYPPNQHQIITFAQHESTHEIAERHDLLSHREDGHFVQYTNMRASKYQTSQSFLQGQSSQALQHVKQRKDKQAYHNNAYHVRWLRSQLKKKESRRKSKLKKELKKAKEKRKMKEDYTILKNENIALIKIILPLDNVRLSRQHYNTFLDYTVNVIMEHNHVTRETVLSITYESYTEITETKNGDRYILYSGNPQLLLDKEQYDCLLLYVRFARTKVLKDIEGLEDNGDTIFLFITYDGKSTLEQYQNQSSMKTRKKLLYSLESDDSSCSIVSSSSETESSDVYDMGRGEDHRSRMSRGLASTTTYDNPFNFRVIPYRLPAMSEHNTSLNNENMVPIQQNNSDSTKSSRKRKNNQKINNNYDCNDNEGKKRCFEAEHEMPSVCIPEEENGNQEISVLPLIHNNDIANHNNGMQENDYDTSIEDLMKDIDKELASVTSL